jgi:LCP family protein required for cell wall assembly
LADQWHPPEHWNWDLPQQPPSPRRSLEPAHDFRRTILFTIAGTIIPGLGLIAAKRRIVGSVVLGLFAAGVLAISLYALLDRQGLLAYALNPTALTRLAAALIVLAVVWVGVVIASHLSLRGRVTSAQRAAGGILVGLLAFAVAAPLAVAANYSFVTAASVSTVFKSEKQSKSATRPTLAATQTTRGQPKPQNPWVEKPRLNLLLLGGDAGPGRIGTRTDTIIMASIDTETGDTTMFSLPRNTGRMPFPEDSPLHDHYPYGFTAGDGSNPEYFLNAMYQNLPNQVPRDVLGETDNLAADALKLSVGEALGLQVDYYVLINLQGFSKMINALGGIKVNVNTYIPIGGNTDKGIPPSEYIAPGPNKKLNGREALWYARGRYGSDDYARMDRQRCVINAIIKQANPANMLARYEEVAKAGKQIVLTDLPQEVLPLMVDLSLRVKKGNVRSIVFKNGVDGFLSANPDFVDMRKRVKIALNETKKAKPSTKKKKSGSTPDAEPSTVSDDINDSCAYDPQVAATSQPPR